MTTLRGQVALTRPSLSPQDRYRNRWWRPCSFRKRFAQPDASVHRESADIFTGVPSSPKPEDTAPLTVEGLVAAHTQRELMVMAGTKSKRSKKQLAQRILTK